MSGRPTSITVIAWILIAIGILDIVGRAVSMLRNNPAANERTAEWMAKIPVPIPIQHTMSIAGTAVSLVCGYFLLRGRNWARYLYVIWMILGAFYSLVISQFKFMLIPGMAFVVLISYLLFRPPANAFFAAGGANVGTQSRPSTRRVISIVCYVLAGFFFCHTCVVAFMWTPGELLKWLMLSFGLLPAAVFLSIGRALSPALRWSREVGIVLIASAAAGTLIVLMLALMFIDPAFQKSLPPEKIANSRGFYGDYVTGGLWIALLGAVGGISLWVAQRQDESPRRKPRIPKIVGR